MITLISPSFYKGHNVLKKDKPGTNDSETKILKAAEKVFAEKGLGGARVKDIADLCQVNPALINYYFGSKENLYRIVIENFFQRVERIARSVIEQDLDPREKLSKLIEAGIDLLGEKEHISRILLREFIDSGKYAESLTKRYLRELFSTSSKFVFSDLEKKGGAKHETMHLLFSILGSMTTFFICGPVIKDIWKRDIFTKKMIEERKQEVINLVFNGIGKLVKE